MSTGQKLASGAVTVVLLVLTAALSMWTVPNADGDAFIRVSWRTEPIRVEECRTLSEEELAEVPAHMRRDEECTGYYVDYVLRVRVDGREVVADTLAPSGLRRDRPVYVLHDEPVEPGSYDVDVTFSALVPGGYRSDDLPVSLRWSGAVELTAGEVGLVTTDDAGRRLVHPEAEGE